ncbi:MAG: indole-3-glycerol phosphate synthase TrpC [Ichthyobacteriaceae bacterium]|nr:indole-3-glycerol phosphate synthase TrpC [Ichthyobacteriaceae bacterium]
MTILDKIVEYKRVEVANQKAKVSLLELKNSDMYNRKPYSLKEFLLSDEKSGVISEFKRQSPSKGLINGTAKVSEVVCKYQKAGASAVSVLTDNPSFGGAKEDLIEARKVLQIPILRKDFVIDDYQIHEAKSWGADIILLIASILTKEEIEQFSALAKSLGLSILFEVHNEDELLKISDNIDIVGVNNRNLATFEVSIKNSIKLVDKIPNRCVKVSESGISEIEKINELQKYGFKGFLIGENFMKTDNPGDSAIEFIGKL